MSGNTSVVSSTPGFVSGTFGAKDVRLATMTNEAPGLFASGDFAVSQRAAGANMSLDIADGRALINPAVSTHQGLYLARKSAGTAYNTSVDGGYTWTAADATNPRIDLLCIEVKDTAEDASGVIGYRFRIVDGTANAGATHQLATTYWPAIPTGCLPIAAIRVPALATTLTTTNITNLNPIAGGRPSAMWNTSAETTTSTAYTRLTTPDFAFVYVPNTSCRIRVFSEGWWKISVASGTQAITLFLNDVQLKYRNMITGAPAAGELTSASLGGSLGTFHSRFATLPSLTTSAAGQFFTSAVGATSDVSDVTSGIAGASATPGPTALEITQLAAGWYVIEQRYKTSANTLTVDERRMWAEVIG